MRRVAIMLLGAVVFAGGCSTTGISASAPRTIVVDGAATLDLKPDVFKVSASIIARNPDSATALREVSDRLERIRIDLPRVDGLQGLTITTSDISIGASYDSTCVRENDYRASIVCPPTGRVGTVKLDIQGAPADLAGRAISILSELGAEGVELTAFSLKDPLKSRNDAVAAAVEDARVKAEAIARASGATILGIEKVQYGNGFSNNNEGIADAFSIMNVWDEQPAAGLIMPAVDLSASPAPINVSARVVVSFLIR